MISAPWFFLIFLLGSAAPVSSPCFETAVLCEARRVEVARALFPLASVSSCRLVSFAEPDGGPGGQVPLAP